MIPYIIYGAKIVWICDPMHGNTYTNQFLQKIRKYEGILWEMRKFWQIHRAEGTIRGGILK
jgi:3-deoxy-7-phosphoheptulonate synthase